MTRLRINGVEEEVVAATLAELLGARGIDLKARFLAVAVNGAGTPAGNLDLTDPTILVQDRAGMLGSDCQRASHQAVVDLMVAGA